MSNPPNNPYERGGAGYPSGPDPYNDPPRKKSNVWVWVVGVIAVLSGLAVLVCCGGGFLAFQFGKNIIGEQVKAEFQADPSVQENVGEIESVQMNLTATGQFAQENEGQQGIVFDVQGSKGNAQIVIRQGSGGEIESGELILPDGSRMPLTPSGGPSFDMGEDVMIPEADPVLVDPALKTVPADSL